VNIPQNVMDALRKARSVLETYKGNDLDPTQLDGNGKLRVLAELDALLNEQRPEPEPAARARCPECGGEDVTVQCDAYANYTLWGFDAEGLPILLDEPDVQTFDDRTYVCDDCGHEDKTARRFLAASDESGGNESASAPNPHSSA
jgi:DNA-directed RNA polymerase subunit M/transcription elongation factor TFIIS